MLTKTNQPNSMEKKKILQLPLDPISKCTRILHHFSIVLSS